MEHLKLYEEYSREAKRNKKAKTESVNIHIKSLLQELLDDKNNFDYICRISTRWALLPNDYELTIDNDYYYLKIDEGAGDSNSRITFERKKHKNKVVEVRPEDPYDEEWEEEDIVDGNRRTIELDLLYTTHRMIAKLYDRKKNQKKIEDFNKEVDDLDDLLGDF